MSRVFEVFPDWIDGGVFKRLGTTYSLDFEWASQFGETLDTEYMFNHSGNKITSPLIDKLMVNGVINNDGLNKLVDVLRVKYLNKWTRLYDITKSEYNPIENYSMIEEETPNITREVKTNIDTVVTVGGDTDGSVYAFNSQTPSPQTTSNTSTTTTTKADEDANTSTETESGTRTLTRSGNIGVTTSQQMIESEVALWQWSFFNTVFEDVDNIFTINMYGGD